MKRTLWTSLPASECQVREGWLGSETGDLCTLLVEHPALPGRRRTFTQSRAGRWYSRYTGLARDPAACGYIIDGPLNMPATVPIWRYHGAAVGWQTQRRTP